VPGYRLLEPLGRGAGGTVWRADPPSAIKLVRGGPDAEREVAVLGRVRHPHVTRLLDVVPLGGGDLALVLQLIEGTTLGALLAGRGRLTPGEVVTVLAPLAQALEQLHSQGVQHGDLAPGNVLLDREGRPWLTDLGTVRLTGERRPEVFGTAGFVDPVVLAGAEPGPESDVYGLGALAWCCLTGRPPAPAPLRPGLAHVLRDLEPEGVQPAVLVGLVEQALDPDPSRRPTPGELAHGLHRGARPSAGDMTHRIRVLAATPDVEGPRHRGPTWRGRCRSWTPRGRLLSVGRGGRRPMLLAVAVLVLAGGLGSVLLTRGGDDANAATTRAGRLGVARPATPPVSSSGSPRAPERPLVPASAVSMPAAAAGRGAAPGGAALQAVLMSVARARADVLAAPTDPGAVSRWRTSVAPGSPAERADRSDLAELVELGLAYRGVRLDVAAARVVSAASDRVVVDVQVTTSGYDVVDARGTVRSVVPTSGPRAARLQLVPAAFGAGWVLAASEAVPGR
jgi:hypothetical protein